MKTRLLALLTAASLMSPAPLWAAVPIADPLQTALPSKSPKAGSPDGGEAKLSDPTAAFLEGGPLSAAKTSSSAKSSSVTKGRTLYVSKSGSDSKNGSQNSPWRSLKHAVSQLKAGDTLVIGEGTYEENVRLNVSGRSDAWITIQGQGNVVINGKKLGAYDAIFNTNGKNYYRFKNLSVVDARAAVEVTSGSSFIEVDGLKSDRNDFAVYVRLGSNVTVRNAKATNSRNAFRAEGSSKNLLYENIETYGSKDVYPGYDRNYLNGDGFIFEDAVSNVTLRNIISADHWDCGFDIKASNVVVDGVTAYGNKNNLKLWGKNISVSNALLHHGKRQLRTDGSYVDGHGINIRRGSVSLNNVTVVDNGATDIKVEGGASLSITNSIVSRKDGNFKVLGLYNGKLTQKNVLWHGASDKSSSVPLSNGSKWADPKFVDRGKSNYRLQKDSPAVNFTAPSSNSPKKDRDLKPRVVGAKIDLGAYEYQGSAPSKTAPSQPAPSKPSPSKPAPSKPAPSKPAPSKPAPKPAASSLFTGITDGGTVKGTVKFQPDTDETGKLNKVFYYLNGTKSGREYDAPYTWGGSAGFDTRKLKNGTYTLKAVYTTDGQDKTYLIKFTVKN